MQQTFSRGLLVLSPALALAALSGCAGREAPASGSLAPSLIDGRAIVVLCDADMSATTFFDNQLGSNGGAADQLTTISLPITDAPDAGAARWSTRIGQLAVSSSVMGPPCAIAVSPDGSRCFVVETHKPAAPGQTMLDQLGPGTALTAVDLTEPSAPAVLATMDVGVQPVAADVHPGGEFVAVATQTPGQQLVIVQTSALAPLWSKWTFPLASEGGAALKPSSIAWHPSGRYFAVTIPDTNQVAFFEFNPDGTGPGIPGIAPWGAPVNVGKFPFSGRFSRDGRFFIYTELMWAIEVPGFMAGAPAGRVGVIRLSDKVTAVDAAGMVDTAGVVHEVTGGASVGISPESLALSPAGNLIATGNLKRSFLPEGDAQLTPGGSLSLLGFDPASGAINLLSDNPTMGMPEGITFDATGKHVIVSEFRSFDPGSTDGELAFYKLVGDKLVFCGFYVAVGRGPHSVAIVR